MASDQPTARCIDHIIANRYHLAAPLGSGGMGTVYRAVDQLTGETVALKRVTIQPERLLFNSKSATQARLAVAHEFRVLASLHHPHIIQVLDYGFDAQHMPYFTMTLLENAQPITHAAQRLPDADKIKLLLELLSALVYLQRRDILHRDLKPSNILVTDEGQVKVLDFGVSVERSAVQGIAGTVAYMAPEVIANEQATHVSDLFSVGMIAYECFAGKHPFNTQNLAGLMLDLLNTVPPLNTLPVPDGLRAVIGRLLAKHPSERYPDAEVAIKAFCDAAQMPLPPESVSIRRSFLEAARFIGRGHELHQLSTALDQSLTGQGSAWLVQGESGVGKSRLGDEIRIQALVKGFTVVRGGAVEGGGLPYQVLRTVLPPLLLTTEVSDIEAGVLLPVVPNIADLLNRRIMPVPEIDPKAAEKRLIEVVLAIFKRQNQPLLAIFEDLQWAQQSLAVIRALGAEAVEQHWLVIATSRSDEIPYLFGMLPEYHVLDLPRLNGEETQALAVSMLGDVGRQTSVVRLLVEQTEGNIFFMIDLLNALVTTSSRLEQIGRITLPVRLLSQGVAAAARRRMERLRLDDLPMLRLAAVIGRVVDFALLYYHDDEMHYGDWLLECVNASFFNYVDGNWQFAHDMLRDGVLHNIAPDVLPQLHRMAAEAIEAVYPDNYDYALRLMHHWHVCGDLAKEAHYAFIAGKQLSNAGRFEDAKNLFQRAKDLTAPEIKHYAEILERLGYVLTLLGEQGKALTYYQQIIEAAAAPDDTRITALFHAGDLLMKQGKLAEAAEHGQQAATLAEDTQNPFQQTRVLQLLARIAMQQEDSASAKELLLRALSAAEIIEELTTQRTIHQQLGILYASEDFEMAEAHFLEALRIDRVINAPFWIAVTYINLGSLEINRKRHQQALLYFFQALDIFRKENNTMGIGAALTSLSAAQIEISVIPQVHEWLNEAFQIVQAQKIPPQQLALLHCCATLCHKLNQVELAVIWFALLQAHPANSPQQRKAAAEQLNALGKELPAALLEKHVGIGATLTLDEAVARIGVWLEEVQF